MTKKNKPEDPLACRRNKVGGQAVLEGVMMKSGERCCTTVRCPDGTLKTVEQTFCSIRKKRKLLGIPVVRGFVNFIEMMLLSYRTLTVSAEAMGINDIEAETKFEKWLMQKFGKSIMPIIMTISTVLGVVLALGLFMYIPALLTGLVDKLTGNNLGWFKNLVEGVIKIGIFILYMVLVSLMKDIRRTFEYHGAEHKSIFCYESGEELTPENVKKYSRFHPRCGTSFIFVILIFSILVNSLPFVTWDNMLLRVCTKLLLLPLIMGIGFEFIMYAGKHDNIFVKIMSAPGLWMQRITTREPDAGQIETAIRSLKRALPDEFPDELSDAEISRSAAAEKAAETKPAAEEVTEASSTVEKEAEAAPAAENETEAVPAAAPGLSEPTPSDDANDDTSRA